MKKLQAGLVIEGNLTSSVLLRLPVITAELGPIKSSSLQVSRRVSNFLKGGYAVKSWDDLANARTILIRVPDTAIERVVEELAEAALNWNEHTFVLCETWAPTEMLEPLKAKGATIASIVALPSGQERLFAVEGDLHAVRQTRRLIERSDTRALELRSGSKHLLFAASVLCAAIPIPVLLMAQQALREGGVSGNELSGAIEGMSNEMLAGFFKGARTTWGGPLADSIEPSQTAHWRRLGVTHPEFAVRIKELVDWSRTYMERKRHDN